MRNNRMNAFIKLLINSIGFVKSEEICNELSIGARTLRNDIREYKKILIENGLQIISKNGVGYQIQIIDEVKYHTFIARLLKEEENAQRLLPVYPEDRVNYLLKLFLNCEGYVKLDDIAEDIFISRSTLQNDVKEVKNRLHFFHLELISKPGYGMKVEGNEIHKRSCISQYFFHTDSMDELFMKRNQMDEKQSKIGELLFDTLDESDFRLTDIGFQNLIIHISISLLRINESIFDDTVNYDDINNSKEYEIAKSLVKRINKEFHVTLKEIEICYIAIHLMGKKTLQYHRGYSITKEIELLLEQIFIEVEKIYDYDFTKDFELYTVLALHFQPMLNRLKYGLNIQNPLLNQIKLENHVAFEMSVISADVIENQTNYVLAESEIGYLALHFALAIDRAQKACYTKKNVIIVCASGAGSSQILAYKIKQRFHDYIDQIKVIELYKLDSISLSEYDFILSTIPIPFATRIPTIQVQYFLNGNDMVHLSDIFTKNSNCNDNFIDKYFKEKLFFTNIKKSTREEVIHELIIQTTLVEKLPDDFEDSVIERELYAATEFGNLVAMPHAMKTMCDETFVSVCILEKPIKWNKQYVQYVFLMCIAKNNKESLSLFHETISSLVMDQEALYELGNEPTVIKFKTIIKKIKQNSESNGGNLLFK
ncbi:MAG: BglG family transcription antiterminator [Bacilli bacterium]